MYGAKEVDIKAMNDKALAHSKKGEFDEAIKLYDQALEASEKLLGECNGVLHSVCYAVCVTQCVKERHDPTPGLHALLWNYTPRTSNPCTYPFISVCYAVCVVDWAL